MELPVAPTRILQQGRWPWNYQGDDPSYALSAAVMEHSLRAHTKHDMVLMYTDDVDGVWLSICKRAGWKLQLVDHIEFKKELYPSGRFAHVFTSLQAVAMVKYDEVIVLDRELFERALFLPAQCCVSVGAQSG